MHAEMSPCQTVIESGEYREVRLEWLERVEKLWKIKIRPYFLGKKGGLVHPERVSDGDKPLGVRRGLGDGESRSHRFQIRKGEADAGAFQKRAAGNVF